MKKTGPLTVGLAAVALAGAGAFTAHALSGGEPVPAPITQVAAQTGTQAPPPAEVAAVATGEAHAAELTAKLAGANILPGHQLSAVPGSPGPLRFYPIGTTSADGYKATAIIEDAAGKSTLTVFVRSARKQPECTAANNCVVATPVPEAKHLPALAEDALTRPNGTVVQVSKATTANGRVKMLAANAKLADGTVVTAVVRAEVEKDNETVSSRADVPLTQEQILALVERPGFHY